MTGHDEPLPPSLDDLGERLREAAAREAEVDRRVERLRRRYRRRAAAAVVLGLVVPIGGVAGADRLLDREGEPSSGLPPGDSPELVAAGDGLVPASATADPDGGPPWVMRVFVNRKGEECVDVGRMRRGRFGQVTPDGAFHHQPRPGSGMCGKLAADEGFWVMQQDWPHLRRVVVYGLAPAGARVDLDVDGRVRAVTAGALGTWIVVLPTTDRELRMSASVEIGGRRIVRPMYPSG